MRTGVKGFCRDVPCCRGIRGEWQAAFTQPFSPALSLVLQAFGWLVEHSSELLGRPFSPALSLVLRAFGWLVGGSSELFVRPLRAPPVAIRPAPYLLSS